LGHSSFDAIPDPIPNPPGLPLPTDLLFEDFENEWLPPGWTRIQNLPAHHWDRTSLKSHSGLYSVWVHYSDPGEDLDEWLVTPAMNFMDRSRIYLRFHEDQDYWAGFGGHHYIMISTTLQDDPAAFTTLVDWTPDNHIITGFQNGPTVLDLSDYIDEPQVYLAFRYTGAWADNWYIDDVRVFFPDDNDVMAVAVSPDQTQFEGDESIVPEVIAANIGRFSMSRFLLASQARRCIPRSCRRAWSRWKRTPCSFRPSH